MIQVNENLKLIYAFSEKAYSLMDFALPKGEMEDRQPKHLAFIGIQII